MTRYRNLADELVELGEPMPFEPDEDGPMAPSTGELAELTERRAKLVEVAELVGQWNEAARAVGREIILDWEGREHGAPCPPLPPRRVTASHAYELCAAQLAAVLARPARPNADDGEE